MSARLPIVVAVLTLSSCGPPPPAADIAPRGSPTSRVDRTGSSVTVRLATAATAAASTITGDLEQVWSVMPAVYAALSIPVGVRDAGRHVIGNREFTVRRNLGEFRLSQLVNCGYGPAGKKADHYLVEMRVLTQLSPADEGSVSARTSVVASASTVEGTSTDEVRCPSTGALEAAIAKGDPQPIGVEYESSESLKARHSEVAR